VFLNARNEQIMLLSESEFGPNGGWRPGSGRLSSGLRGLASLAPSDLRRGGQSRGGSEGPGGRGGAPRTVYFSPGLDTMFKVSRSGGGSLRGWNRRPAEGRWSREAPASVGCSVGSAAPPHESHQGLTSEPKAERRKPRSGASEAGLAT